MTLKELINDLMEINKTYSDDTEVILLTTKEGETFSVAMTNKITEIVFNKRTSEICIGG